MSLPSTSPFPVTIQRLPEAPCARLFVVDHRWQRGSHDEQAQERVYRRVTELARTFRLNTSAFPFIQSVEAQLGDLNWMIVVRTRVVDRTAHAHSTQADLAVTFTYVVTYVSTRDTLEAIWDAVTQVVNHELRESLYVDGVRVYDPHK